MPTEPVNDNRCVKSREVVRLLTYESRLTGRPGLSHSVSIETIEDRRDEKSEADSIPHDIKGDGGEVASSSSSVSSPSSSMISSSI